METDTAILIVDDDPVFLAISEEIVASLGYQRCETVDNASAGIEKVRGTEFGLIILDLNMPRLGGVEAIEQIRTFDPAASIVILTTYQGDEDVYRALRAGAKAYLLKDSGPDQLTDCLRTVASGKQFLPAAVASKLAERQTSSPLSRRELEILAHLATGKSNKMIARSAAIEVGTVKFHVNNILAKLNVGSRTEAATVAARRGLISAF